MAEKRYYWLKLKEDFFRDKRIKKLRSIAGGDVYTIIYLKMQLLSLKDEGKLFFENVEDTFAQELALEIDESQDDVQVCLNFLEKNGLIEMIENNEFILPQTQQSIGSESSSAERVRRFRAKENQKALPGNADVTNCNTEIEKEIDIEKDKDIYLSNYNKEEPKSNFCKQIYEDVDRCMKKIYEEE